MPKIYSSKFAKRSPISRLVWHIDRICLHLPGGFRWWPIQWNYARCCAADPFCHGNDIWARRGDLVAYRLVVLLKSTQSGSTYGNVAVHRKHQCSRDFHCTQSHSRYTLHYHSETCPGTPAPDSLPVTSKHFTFLTDTLLGFRRFPFATCGHSFVCSLYTTLFTISSKKTIKMNKNNSTKTQTNANNGQTQTLTTVCT